MIRVGKARKEDLVEIHKLLLSAFPNASARIGEGDEFFIARDPEVVGFAHYVEDGKKIVLKGFAVSEGRRKQGVGGLILDALIAHANKAKKSVYLKTKAGNPALRLYTRKGFCFKRLKGETLTMVFRIVN
jgi:GNAT superfamily N-acetyltransferase